MQKRLLHEKRERQDMCMSSEKGEKPKRWILALGNSKKEGRLVSLSGFGKCNELAYVDLSSVIDIRVVSAEDYDAKREGGELSMADVSIVSLCTSSGRVIQHVAAPVPGKDGIYTYKAILDFNAKTPEELMAKLELEGFLL